MMPILPCAITVVSFLLRALFLTGALGPWWGLVGLLLDAADGAIARRLRACTTFGAELDWHGDVACAALGLATLARHLSPPLAGALCVVLVPGWALAKARRKRVSGSALVVGSAIVLRLLGGNV